MATTGKITCTRVESAGKEKLSCVDVDGSWMGTVERIEDAGGVSIEKKSNETIISPRDGFKNVDFILVPYKRPAFDASKKIVVQGTPWLG